MSTDIYAAFRTSKPLETDGIWLDYGAFKVRIARAGGANKRFARIFRAKTKPYQRQMDNDTMDEEVSRRLMAEAYAEAVILDWSPCVDPETGDTVAHSQAFVIKTILALPDLFFDIQQQAARFGNFRAEDLASAEKNSASVSPGNSPMAPAA